MDTDAYLAHLVADMDAIRATPLDALDRPVGACPGWTVADLVGHQAGVFCFATAQLRAEPGSDMVAFDPPDPSLAPLDRFAAAADALVAEFGRVDPTEHRPSFVEAADASFWWRRMAHETAIHRFDAQAAHTTPEPIDAVLAVDGIDELIEVYLAHAAARGVTGSGETVHLHATDDLPEGVSGEWMFLFTETGVAVEHAHGKGDMAVRGTASDLVLFVWNRRPIDVQTFGEPDPLTFWPDKVRL